MFVMLGCDKPVVKEPSYEIGFASQMNRSVVEGVEDLRERGIKLFGTLHLEDKILSLLDAEELYYDEDLANWDYTNTRYWTPQLEHRFYALWPYDTTCTFSGEDAVVAIDYTAGAKSADLLYTVVSRTPINESDYSAVPLYFNHACAALQFNIVNASDKVVSSVNEIYLVGLKYKGKFTFGMDGMAEWSVGSEVVAADDYITYKGDDMSNLPIDINTKQSLYAGGAILVLPQEIADTDVKIHLAIKKNGSATVESKEIMLGKLGGSTPTKWEAGRRYEYTMTITENSIVSNVKVVPWVDHYVDL
jgi:hypothetical protein